MEITNLILLIIILVCVGFGFLINVGALVLIVDFIDEFNRLGVNKLIADCNILLVNFNKLKNDYKELNEKFNELLEKVQAKKRGDIND